MVFVNQTQSNRDLFVRSNVQYSTTQLNMSSSQY